MFPITIPDFDPIALAIGPLQIRWYSLAYIAGIISTLYWLKSCNNSILSNGKKLLSHEAYDNWIVWAIVSILFGGRLGYVLFYNPFYFFSNPLEIFAIWHGGMSFHGGLIGSGVGMYLFAKKYKIEFLRLTDILAVIAPIGLFFGRVANFINMELYGRVTGSNFGVIFPNAGTLPRHPSQLYEAFFEGLLSFAILFSLHYFAKKHENKGYLTGLFLILYASSRILVENFREPDEQIGFLFYEVTMGQFLSLPIIFLGLFLIFRSKKN